MKQYLEERIAYLKNIEREKLDYIDKVPLGPLRSTQWELIREIGARKNELQNALRWLETEQLHKPVVGGPASASGSQGEQLPAEGQAQNGRDDDWNCKECGYSWYNCVCSHD